MLSKLLISLHHSLNHHETAEPSIICDKCGTGIKSLGEANNYFMNGEKFRFCSLTCLIEFKNTITDIERLTHLIDLGAKSFVTTTLPHETELVATE
jgi:hypothetical protein